MAKKPILTIVDGQARKKPGPKRWEPSRVERRMVEKCVALGFTTAQVSAVIGKSEASLKRHCRVELDHGADKVKAMVGSKLISKAMHGDTAALIFFAKTRLGFRERQVFEHTGANGGPIVHEHLRAEADAFTERVLEAGRRYMESQAPAAPPLEAIALPPPSPNEVN